MIPKTIHYCWFGRKELPPLAKRCIESWKKYLPDYEIREWNEDNFDVNAIKYTAEAYKAKKYAFVSDYARFWILYHHGGVYFDIDVEVIRPLDDIVAKGNFMGCENIHKDGASPMSMNVAPGLGLGVEPHHHLFQEIMETYKTLSFVNPDGSYNCKTIVAYTTELLCRHGLQNTDEIQYCADFWIYPKDYFAPINVIDGKLNITSNTRTIHHYAQTWVSPFHRTMRNILLKLGGGKIKALITKHRYK